MKITRVHARALHIEFPIGVLGITDTQSMNCVFTEVETDDGHIGYGFSAITNVATIFLVDMQISAVIRQHMEKNI